MLYISPGPNPLYLVLLCLILLDLLLCNLWFFVRSFLPRSHLVFFPRLYFRVIWGNRPVSSGFRSFGTLKISNFFPCSLYFLGHLSGTMHLPLYRTKPRIHFRIFFNQLRNYFFGSSIRVDIFWMCMTEKDF